MIDASQELKRILVAIDETIAVAESLTGGRLQAAITAVSGSSNYFEGGVTAYNLDQKAKLLGVDREHADSVNCVSSRVAKEMAAGVRDLFGSFVGVATTGYAEPWPDGGIETPHAFYAIDIGGWITAGKVEESGLSRVEMQDFVVQSVMLDIVRQFARIEGLDPFPPELLAVREKLRKGNP